MPIKLTEKQELAVNKNGNILVAAAAGSGKTAVLVERVINKLCRKENPVSADSLLIVTFTNAAAAEMRGRIEKRLEEECRLHPEDSGLLLQKHLLSSASICTIDSFCIDLVRENFEKLEISPDFTISEESALRPIYEKIIAELLYPYFESKNSQFFELLDLIGAEYDEGEFVNFFLDIYRFSRQLPFPELWLRNLPSLYSEFSPQNPWRKKAFEIACGDLTDARLSLAKAIDLIALEPQSADRYLSVFSSVAEAFNTFLTLAENEDWDGLVENLETFSFLSLPRITNADKLSSSIMLAREIYGNIKADSLANIKQLFCFDTAFISSQFKKIYPSVKLLSELLGEFDRLSFEALSQENTFTFYHTEAMALKLLCSIGPENGVEINTEAQEFLHRFSEVCVDEYQDTNDLQNMLFYVLSNRDSNLFAVGDLKQSIYGFRGANPDHFLKKKNDHIDTSVAKEGDPLKIILGNNFRSRPEVCQFINYFFSLFMTKETGNIVYDEEEMLIPSGKFPESQQKSVYFRITEAKGSEESKKICEARQIARFIKETMSKGEVIREDENTLRKPRFSDFTILFRNLKNNAPTFAEELRRHGIPVNYSGEGFCEFTEIAVMLSLLKVIDNPANDVELLSVMMSPIFGFTAEEMAKIKIATPKGDLYSAVVLSAQNGNSKAEGFLRDIAEYRLFAVTNTVPSLINILLEKTGFLNAVSAFNGGEKRRNNLRLLVQYAQGYSATSGSSLGGFIRYIEKRNETGIKSATATAGDDGVNLMTIHSSKGLQFPVCIVACTADPFSAQENRKGAVYSTDLGIGFKYFDEDDKTKYTTVSREVILQNAAQKQLEEELRLFYVAMTRTQDILYFAATVSEAQKSISEVTSLLTAHDFVITKGIFKSLNSYYKWLLAATLLHPDAKEIRGNGRTLICKETNSHIECSIEGYVEVEESENSEKINEILPDEKLIARLKENFTFKYPFEQLLGVEAKASVSALANKAESEKHSFTVKPAFMSNGGITATGRGTAMHKVMQFFDFAKHKDIEGEIERLYEWKFLSEAEAKSVSREALKHFFESEVFTRIINAETLKREMRFLTELPAKLADSSLGEELSNETIIVQGAVDVCFVEKDGIVVLDFKTDRTENPNDLIEAYGEQLKIYGLACEKIFGLPVKEKIIYSFFLSKEIKL